MKSFFVCVCCILDNVNCLLDSVHCMRLWFVIVYNFLNGLHGTVLCCCLFELFILCNDDFKMFIVYLDYQSMHENSALRYMTDFLYLILTKQWSYYAQRNSIFDFFFGFVFSKVLIK